MNDTLSPLRLWYRIRYGTETEDIRMDTLDRLLVATRSLKRVDDAITELRHRREPLASEFSSALVAHAVTVGCPHVTHGGMSALSAPGCNVLGHDFVNWECAGLDAR